MRGENFKIEGLNISMPLLTLMVLQKLIKLKTAVVQFIDKHITDLIQIYNIYLRMSFLITIQHTERNKVLVVDLVHVGQFYGKL